MAQACVMTFTWDPDRYLTYADERGRPFLDLIGRIGDRAPRTVLDLGCGAGNLTALLAEHWSDARVAGLDSSAEMIARARADHPDLSFWVEDLREFLAAVSTPVDVLVSNATLQWVPGHLELLPALVGAVLPGGWLAFQVPANFDQPSHTIRAGLAAEPPYAEHLADIAEPSSHGPEVYLGALLGLGCTVDAWETTYLHVLEGADPVFTWVSGTGARPTLEALGRVGLREPFEAEFKRCLAEAYPDTGRGVVMPFRRVFVVAQVPA